MNNLLSLVGPTSLRVQAITSNTTRGFAVEDTAAMVFTFANGALGTFLLSDAAASARSWEQTSKENASYASYPDEDCYHIAEPPAPCQYQPCESGPSRAPGPGRSRSTRRQPVSTAATLWPTRSTHFAAVIRGEAEPICSGRDGLTTLKVVDAVIEAARTGQPVDVEP